MRRLAPGWIKEDELTFVDFLATVRGDKEP